LSEQQLLSGRRKNWVSGKTAISSSFKEKVKENRANSSMKI